MLFPRRVSLPMLLAGASAINAAPMASNELVLTAPSTGLRQCSPATFSWTPTTSPYFLSVLDPSSVLSATLDSDDTIVLHDVHTVTWIVDAPAGKEVTVVVRDATGEIAQTGTMLVGDGPSDCFDEDGLVL